jgi:ubiquinol-cytochrome c reductase cytochrome b subunit
LTEWIRGDYFISDATLNRFFALHVIAIPLALLVLVVLHLAALHQTGSNNPDGIEIKKLKDEQGIPLDGIPFHPYYTVKDIFGVAMFLLIMAFIIFFWPEAGGLFLEHDNFVPADPLVTPIHIKPVWYFTPYYAILKAVPDKLMGVLLMGASVLILFFVPWIDRAPVKSIRYRGMQYKIMLGLFAVAFIRLGMLGMAEGTPSQTIEMRVWTFVYFAFFILLFFLSPREKTKPVPERVTH